MRNLFFVHVSVRHTQKQIAKIDSVLEVFKTEDFFTLERHSAEGSFNKVILTHPELLSIIKVWDKYLPPKDNVPEEALLFQQGELEVFVTGGKEFMTIQKNLHWIILEDTEMSEIGKRYLALKC